MKKRRVTLAAAAICLLLTGCSGLSLKGSDILTPPRAEGSQAEIQELIQKSAGSRYEMVYPESGEYNSSVIFKDLDGDGNDEAIAMYTRDRETVEIMFADNNGARYSELSEQTVHASSLSSIEFADFGGSSNKVVITYPGSSANLQSMTVFSVDDGEVDREDWINSCADHLICDCNGDGKEDLLTLALADGENLPTARLFTGSDGELTEQSSCEIASDTKEYVSLSFGKINDEIIGAVVDAKGVDKQYSTQIICYDYNERSIINPLYVNNDYSKTKRSSEILSADINHDGVIEIPICGPMDYSQNEESSAVCDRIDWSCYDYTQLSLTTKQSAILCDNMGFLLNLTPEHADIVTARKTGENSMAVYLWEYKNSAPERTTKLLTIKRYEKSSYNKDEIIEAVLAKNNDWVYTYVIETEDGFYGFTDEEVKNNFVLIENQPKE